MRRGKRINCPKCGKLVDGYTAAGTDKDATPSEGDYSICFYCCTILIYGPNAASFSIPETYPKFVGMYRDALRKFMSSKLN